MEIVYLHIPDYRGFKNAKINFREDVVFEHDIDNGVLNLKTNQATIPSDFWCANIINLTMIVGNNGDGKTGIMQFIITIFNDILLPKSNIEGLMIFKDRKRYYYYVTQQYRYSIHFQNLRQVDYSDNLKELLMENTICQIDKANAEKILGKTKLVYKTETLSYEDYKRNEYARNGKYDFFYDCSFGSLIVQDGRNDTNSYFRYHNNIYGNLNSYFFYEQYKQIKFVFDKNQSRIIDDMIHSGYPLPLPEVLFIDLLIYKDTMLYELGDYTWKSKIMSFIFANDRLADVEVNSSNMLSLELARSTVRNAFSSFFRFLNKNDKNELINRLKRYDEDNKEQNVENGLNPLMCWLWDNVKIIMRTKRHNSSYYSGIYSILRLKQNYLNFLNYIMKEPILDHFKYLDEDAWRKYVDIPVLTFFISTKDKVWFSEFIKKYIGICNPDYFLDFRWLLSSGEKNILSLFSSFYYIFDSDNIKLEYRTYKIKNKLRTGELVSCNSIIIMIDEADLTFHPQWQTEYISMLVEFLSRIYPIECCKNIQLIISTHSPILLGDVPSECIRYLRYNSQKNCNEIFESKELQTFGKNIYLLFKDSFFLENGVMGRFAKEKINDIFNMIEKIDTESRNTDHPKILLKKLTICENLCEIIAEPIIRNKLKIKIANIRSYIENQAESTALDEYENIGNLSTEELSLRIKKLEDELKRRRKMK